MRKHWVFDLIGMIIIGFLCIGIAYILNGVPKSLPKEYGMVEGNIEGTSLYFKEKELYGLDGKHTDLVLCYNEEVELEEIGSISNSMNIGSDCIWIMSYYTDTGAILSLKSLDTLLDLLGAKVNMSSSMLVSSEYGKYNMYESEDGYIIQYVTPVTDSLTEFIYYSIVIKDVKAVYPAVTDAELEVFRNFENSLELFEVLGIEVEDFDL